MGSRSPKPPSDLHTKTLPLEVWSAGRNLYRIHRTVNVPKFFGRSGDWRFDAPDASYGTLYVATSPEAAFAETLLRGSGGFVALSELEARSLCKFTVVRELRLVRLYGPNMSSLGATAAVSSGDYVASRQWSRALWSHPEQPDGILYRATFDNDRFAVVLFDRAEAEIDPGATTKLLSDIKLLGRILDQYRASIR